MGIISDIEQVLMDRAQYLNFDKVEIVPTEKLRKALYDHYGYRASRIYGLAIDVIIQDTDSVDTDWSYFTYYEKGSTVDFQAISNQTLQIEHLEIKKEEAEDRRKDLCIHEWKETQGLFKTYKDCVRCKMKWEDYK